MSQTPTQSYWEYQLQNSNQPTIKQVPAKQKFSKADVLIIGAGFMGSWLAYFLLEKNPKLKISIHERSDRNLGASLRNAGFLSCGNISEWLADSLELDWKELVSTLKARIEGIKLIQDAFGSKLSIIPCGSVDIDSFSSEKNTLFSKLNEEIRSFGMTPFFEIKKINYAGNEREVYFNSFDSSVNPGDLLGQLHAHLIDAGVDFHWNSTIERIGHGVAANALGSEFNYANAYICTNAFARNLNPNTIVEPARGQILVTSPCNTPTSQTLGFLRSGFDYYRFIDDRVLVGGGRLEFKSQENTDSFETTSEIRAYLLNLAQTVIGHSDFKIDYHWSGIMGLRKGKHASISDLEKNIHLDSTTQELCGFGGWGVTLTPYIAKLRAEAF